MGRQPWPGNIRELRNVLEQASLMTDELVLTARHFGGETAGAAPPAAARSEAAAAAPLPQRRAELEREAIASALVATRGNRVAAAKLLRISRATLYEKLARYPDIAAR